MKKKAPKTTSKKKALPTVDPIIASDSPKSVAAQEIIDYELQRKCCALRCSGASYSEISEILGEPESDVRRHVRNGFDRGRAESLEEFQILVEIESSRLDSLQLSHWNRRSDVKHAETILRIMERRARMLGLDKPEKRELTGAEGEPLIGDEILETILSKLFSGVAPPSEG